MKKNLWNLPYSSDYKQFKLKKIYFAGEGRLKTRYCIIPGKMRHQTTSIVLLQGMGLTMENWSIDFLRRFENYDLYLIDPIKSSDLKDYATSVHEVTKHLSKFNLIGYSFGTFVIQEYLSLYPTESVEHVVLIAGGSVCDYKLNFDPRTMLNTSGYDTNLVLKQGIAAIRARVTMKNCVLSTKINIPILFIKAQNEHLFKVDYNFCGKSEVTIENVDHNLLVRRPIFIADQIIAFLEK
jgi:pimeloyl-ACP methyl ester carboxylesterase